MDARSDKIRNEHIRGTTRVVQASKEIHTCQSSRIRRDSPAFSSDVPRPAKCDRCPEFLENGIIIFLVADYATFLPRNATK